MRMKQRDLFRFCFVSARCSIIRMLMITLSKRLLIINNRSQRVNTLIMKNGLELMI